MDAKDEILAEEIQKTIEKLNGLVVEAVQTRKLRVDIEYFPYQIISVREKTYLIQCKIYKEVL